jgi:hypothetical protein
MTAIDFLLIVGLSYGLGLLLRRIWRVRNILDFWNGE